MHRIIIEIKMPSRDEMKRDNEPVSVKSRVYGLRDMDVDSETCAFQEAVGHAIGKVVDRYVAGKKQRLPWWMDDETASMIKSSELSVSIGKGFVYSKSDEASNERSIRQ